GAGGAGAAALSLAFSLSCCCVVEMLNPVSKTTPTQTNPWRITTSSLRITPCTFGPDKRIESQPTPAGYSRGFYTRELRKHQRIFTTPYLANSAPYRPPPLTGLQACTRLPSLPVPAFPAPLFLSPVPQTTIRRAPAKSSAPAFFLRAALVN